MKTVIRTEDDCDPSFSRWVMGISGAENIRQCIHCGQCSGTCPLSMYMDKSPRRLMHLAREGFKEDVLGSFSIWLCTSCYFCTVKCPRDIKVTEVMYALKRRAIEEGLYPKRFVIPCLAREFGNMVFRNGRITESRLVAYLMLKTNPFKMLGLMTLGLKLLRTGRFDLFAEKTKNRKQVRKLLASLQGNHPESL